MLSAEDVLAGKPDPEIYTQGDRTVRRSGRGRCWSWRTAPRGSPRPASAGAFAVGVPHEHSPAEALQDADLIVPRLDDPALLDRLDGHG